MSNLRCVVTFERMCFFCELFAICLRTYISHFFGHVLRQTVWHHSYFWCVIVVFEYVVATFWEFIPENHWANYITAMRSDHLLCICPPMLFVRFCKCLSFMVAACGKCLAQCLTYILTSWEFVEHAFEIVLFCFTNKSSHAMRHWHRSGPVV